MKGFLCAAFFFLSTFVAFCQTNIPYKNSALPVEIRVKDLLSKMSIEEKFWQMFMISGDMDAGDSAKYSNGIFGFQVTAASKGGDTAGQLIHYSKVTLPLAPTGTAPAPMKNIKP